MPREVWTSNFKRGEESGAIPPWVIIVVVLLIVACAVAVTR
jgi:hypothetical protein